MKAEQPMRKATAMSVARILTAQIKGKRGS